ncbi:hypothetical protein DICPUDRAFT_78070 [Dictyostelium purpureum]|uniref:Akirin n=1 Tax=Dictyostelium purpureum TaxID=5786 RepID=F0ZIG7_DICPU|nr:uncharacterized protein DICPUDRAFT_78070 [Dictyostelium purpureum]EGC36278.1 hypothetical protein DICPUDRAFT_78070 [Dictyostelium purpureum]|eukprot:XP_003287224.1 hypothetical protein DICPUDRAFT_78070 [Dictyostelium purpureum]
MLKLKRNFDSYNDNNSYNNNNNSTVEPYRQPMEQDYDGQSKKFRHFQQQQQQQQQAQQLQRNRSEYQFFNNVQSPIDEILDKIKNTEPIRLNRNNTNNINQMNQNVNNNQNNNINNMNQINNQNSGAILNTNTQQPQRLFTLEEVQEIVKKAVKENEEVIKAEYERIVKDKLIEQYQCFSKYNDDYLSRQMKESEYSYIS